MTQPATQTAPAPFLQGSIIWQKKGPLPVWGWMALVLGVALIWAWLRRRNAPTDTTGGMVDELPGDQTAGPIFIVPSAAAPAVNVVLPTPVTPPTTPPVTPPTTPPPVPPGGGRDTPPGNPVPTSPGTKIPVDSYPAWNSTISGIFAHFKRQNRTTATRWEDVWNHPMNADLRKLRSKPNLIRKGDQVFVPGLQAK